MNIMYNIILCKSAWIIAFPTFLTHSRDCLSCTIVCMSKSAGVWLLLLSGLTIGAALCVLYSQDSLAHGTLVPMGLAIWATHRVIFSCAVKFSIL